MGVLSFIKPDYYWYHDLSQADFIILFAFYVLIAVNACLVAKALNSKQFVWASIHGTAVIAILKFHNMIYFTN